MLVGLDDERGIVRPQERLDGALAAAWLVELMLLERIEERRDGIHVIDDTPTELADLDYILGWIADPQRRSLEGWLDIFRESRPRERVAACLLDRGAVRRDHNRFSGFATYPVVDRAAKQAIQSRAGQAVAAGPAAATRDACLCRLVETAELGTSLWGGAREAMRDRVDTLPDCSIAHIATHLHDAKQRKALLGGLRGDRRVQLVTRS